MFDDTPNQSVTNEQPTTSAPPAANAPATPASPSTPPSTPPLGANDSPQSQASDSHVANPGPIAKRGVQDPQMVEVVDAAQLPHPLVQKAGVLNSVARALAGNPTRTVIDPDGTRRVEPVPLTKGQIGMAIAMEALTGSLAGLQAGRGKGVDAAGMAGFETVRQQRMQEQERQEQQAQTQFEDKGKALAQQASAYSANLRTRALAQEIGMRDEQSHKEWIASHASTAAYIRENEPDAVIKDMAPESEVITPEFTRQALQNGWVAIPVGYTPRFDAQGNHYSQDGVPLHDNLYMIADGRKLTVSPDVIAKAQEWALPGFTNRTGEPVRGLNDIELRVGTILDTNNKIASLEMEQKDLDGYYAYLAGKGVKGADGKPLTAPNLKQLVRQNPALTSYIVGPWANHFGESPSAALKAMKDDLPAKGPISNLYGGKQLLDKYDLLKDIEKKGAEETTAANVEIKKERDLIPIKAETAKAEAQAKASIAATSARNEDGSWNMGSIPVQLVEGGMDPSQLSKRSADYNAKLEAASAYSLQKYGKPFDIAKAQQDYTYAKNPQVQNTLRMINGMTEPGGAIQIAADTAKNLPQFNSSTLNKVFNIAATEFGSSDATNFHSSMLGLADEYSKVMGGGISSDTGRQQSLDLLKAAYSKGQLAGAINIMQRDIAARKSAIVGDNRYLMKQFGGSAQNPNSSSAQAPPVSLLKDGVNTTFANGQTWTLQGGQPVQVNK
jgi:hypothetical protein